MKKLIILSSLISLLLFAEGNPKVYAALGDVIYNDDIKIEKLSNLENMKHYKDRMTQYLKATKEAKAMGFKIEKGDKSVSNKAYLSLLRELSKEHDIFIRNVNSAYIKTMDEKDIEGFTYLSQCSLVDFSSDREKILEFYNTYKVDINSTAVDSVMLEQTALLNNVNKKVVKKDGNVSMPHPINSKIKRIREKERAKEKAKKEAIEQESQRRKQEVQEKQKEELGL